MRVLLLNQNYLPDPTASSQYLARWAEHLVREGHDVTVVASRRASNDPRTLHPGRETREGVKVVRVDGFNSGKRPLGRAINFVSYLLCVLLRGLFLPKPDAIVTLTAPPLLPMVATLLARLRGARLVIWAMDLHPEASIAAGTLSENGVMARIARAASRRSVRRADGVITLDESMRRHLIAQGAEPDRVDVVPLWMQADMAFDSVGRAATRRARGWDQKFVVMCAGNHGAGSSMETVLAAADALRDDATIHFCWVGGGSQWKKLQDHAARNVSLIPYVPREKLAAMLSASDLQIVTMGEGMTGLIHPSKVYNILATRRPFLHIGPDNGPVAAVMQAARLGDAAASFRHQDRVPLARDIQRRARAFGASYPTDANLAPWSESVLLQKMTSALELVVQFPQTADERYGRPESRAQYAGVIAPAASAASVVSHGR